MIMEIAYDMFSSINMHVVARNLVLSSFYRLPVTRRRPNCVYHNIIEFDFIDFMNYHYRFVIFGGLSMSSVIVIGF